MPTQRRCASSRWQRGRLAEAWAGTRKALWRPQQLVTFGDIIAESDLERVQTA